MTVGARQSEAPRALVRLLEVWPEIRDAHFTPDCCLNATRVLLEACRVLLPRAIPRPLVVEVRAVNAAGRRLIEVGDFTTEEWTEAGAHILCCGGDPQTPDEVAALARLTGWSGHLVLVVNGRWFVDGSAAQMNRPAKNLFVPTVVLAKVEPRHLKGCTFALTLSNGGQVAYRAIPEVTEYEGLSGFQRHALNLEVARLLVNCAT